MSWLQKVDLRNWKGEKMILIGIQGKKTWVDLWMNKYYSVNIFPKIVLIPQIMLPYFNCKILRCTHFYTSCKFQIIRGYNFKSHWWNLNEVWRCKGKSNTYSRPYFPDISTTMPAPNLFRERLNECSFQMNSILVMLPTLTSASINFV